MALLPDELLGDILCLAAASNIGSKLAVSQVSRHWRRIALSSPLLWTRICLGSDWDCSSLPLVLDRSGSSALLDIEVSADLELWGPGTAFDIEELDKESRAPLQLERAMHALEAYADRIRILDTAVPTEALLNVGLAFPALSTLRVRSTRTSPFGKVVSKISLTAPNLRVLDLDQVEISNFGDLLGSRLQTIRIDVCRGVRRADLLTVLARCPDLVHLSFRSDDKEVRPSQSLEIPQSVLPLRRMKALDLRLPIPMLLKVLDSALQEGSALSTISVTFPNYPSSPDLALLWSALPFRAGQITQLDIPYEQSITLRDEAGFTFSLILSYAFREPWARLWPCISLAYRAHETIRELVIPLHMWDDLSEDFALHPPQAVLRLRVLMPLLPTHSHGLRRIPFPSLARIEFCGRNSHRFTEDQVTHFLKCIICDPERKIEVVVDGHLDFWEGD